MSAQVDEEMQRHIEQVAKLGSDVGELLKDKGVRVVLTVIEQVYTSAVGQFVAVAEDDPAARLDLLKEIMSGTATNAHVAMDEHVKSNAPTIAVPDSKIILKA